MVVLIRADPAARSLGVAHLSKLQGKEPSALNQPQLSPLAGRHWLEQGSDHCRRDGWAWSLCSGGSEGLDEAREATRDEGSVG